MPSSLTMSATPSPTIKSSNATTSKAPNPISRTTISLSNTIENLKSAIVLEESNLNEIQLLKNKLNFIYSDQAYVTLKKGDISFSMPKGLSTSFNPKFKNAPKAQAKLKGLGIFFNEKLKHTKIDKTIIEAKLAEAEKFKSKAITDHQRQLEIAENNSRL